MDWSRGHIAMELAGHLAAHAVWCVADSATLIPLMGLRYPDGTQDLMRFVDDDGQTNGADAARKVMETNEKAASFATLILDGYMTLEGQRSDALILDIRSYDDGAVVSLAIPYRAKKRGVLGLGGSRFTVYRPRLLDLKGWRESDVDELFDSFWEGVSQHEKGALVWDKHIDQSK